MPLSSRELAERAEALWDLASPCRLCPQACGVDRRAGERGRCGIGRLARVASFGPHFGEEAVLVGSRGSGTVFLSGCNLSCVFCQNADISQGREGTDLDVEDLAGVFLQVARRGCHNLNLVTPTHQAPMIVEGLARAAEAGLDLPVVWNCGGYESVDALRLLKGIVAIYMPDVKYGEDAVARRLSGAASYASRLESVLNEMGRQVGNLAIRHGLAERGVLVRHLVLPAGLAGSEAVFRTVVRALGTEAYVNVMDQYRPLYRAGEYAELSRRPTVFEIDEALSAARSCGLRRGLDEA